MKTHLNTLSARTALGASSPSGTRTQRPLHQHREGRKERPRPSGQTGRDSGSSWTLRVRPGVSAERGGRSTQTAKDKETAQRVVLLMSRTNPEGDTCRRGKGSLPARHRLLPDRGPSVLNAAAPLVSCTGPGAHSLSQRLSAPTGYAATRFHSAEERRVVLRSWQLRVFGRPSPGGGGSPAVGGKVSAGHGRASRGCASPRRAPPRPRPKAAPCWPGLA